VAESKGSIIKHVIIINGVPAVYMAAVVVIAGTLMERV